MIANCGVQVDPVTLSITDRFNAPKNPGEPFPVVSTETAAVLWMIPVTGATVPEEGPLITINPENHAVDVVAISEIVR
jgi:hypothetical protein